MINFSIISLKVYLFDKMHVFLTFDNNLSLNIKIFQIDISQYLELQPFKLTIFENLKK